MVGLLAAVSAGPPAVAKRDPALRVAVAAPPSGWDPHLDLDDASRAHWEHVYESLVQLGPDQALAPAIAESWEQPDPRTYVFRLRAGVRFQHGRELTADDVVSSLERGKRAGGAAGPLAGLTAVEAVGKLAVRVVLASPDAGFLAALADNRGTAIVPAEVVARHGNLHAAIVGTGPYRVKRFMAGQFTEFERHPRYWASASALPRTEEMVLSVVGDEGARLAALRQGAVDVAAVTAAKLADEAAREPALSVLAPPAARRIAIELNHARPPFQSRALRQALSAAVDRDALIRSALLGRGERTSAMPPAAAPCAATSAQAAALSGQRHDAALARRLAAEGAGPKGLAFSLVAPRDDGELAAVARLVEAQAAASGIRVTVELLDAAALDRRRRAGDFQAMLGATGWMPDPFDYVRALGSTSPDNAGRYHNAEADRLLGEARIASDGPRRLELCRRLQAVLAEDAAAVWLMARPEAFEVVRAAVKDYRPRPGLSRLGLERAWIAAERR